MTAKSILTIATRASKLAVWQAEWVKQQLLHFHPHLHIKFLTKITSGDQNTSIHLAHIGGKNLFVKELQSAVLQQEADIAVHSIKDLACSATAGLHLAAICQREDPRDVFISAHFTQFSQLPALARIGTSSPRRECQLKALRSDLSFKLLRGNIDTRLQKLANGEYEAIILAAAGLMRLGLVKHIREYFAVNTLLPAIGQGAIGIECRADDLATTQLLAPLNHPPTAVCVTAERAVNAHLGGDCFTPIAAYATLQTNHLTLKALIGSTKHNDIISAQAEGDPLSASSLGINVAEQLLQKGAKRFLLDK